VCALQSGFLVIDDPVLIRGIESGTLPLKGQRLEYFRPLTGLWFRLDHFLFGANPAGYHATGILFHLVNSLLVYHLATLVFRDHDGNGHWSFIAGMLFAVHPVNTEPVTWIAARSELLCCFFLLLCLIATFKTLQQVTPSRLACIFAFFLCSVMAKEASLFMPFLALIYCYLERKKPDARAAVCICVTLFAALPMYFLFRYGLSGAVEHTLATLLPQGGHESRTVISTVGAFGFYVRKLVYPFPLNIAITEISTAVGILSFIMFAAIATLLWIREPDLRFHLAFLAFALMPPVGAFILNYSWTPYAERYLYIPSLSFAIIISFICRRYFSSIPRSAIVVSLFFIAATAAYRVLVWSDPIRFWRDTAEKSPRFGTVRLVLAAEYLQAGRYAEAERNLRLAADLGLARRNAQEFYQELRIMLDKKRKQGDG
jgi:hypothetical protein